MDSNRTAIGIFAGLCAGALAAGLYLFSTPAGNTVPETLIAAPPYAGTTLLAETAPVPRDATLPAEPAPQRVATIQRAPRPAARNVATPPRPAANAARAQFTPRATDTPSLNALPQPVASTPVVESARAFEARSSTPIEPPAPSFVELVVPAESVLGLQVETSLTSETARVEDEVTATVTRDVRVDDHVAIPAGAIAHGEVTLVERGGRLRDRARLGIRFNSVVLANGTRVPLGTETIYRDGTPHTGENAAKIGGGAVGGAILGGLLGGAKGAIIGGSVGAGAGTAAVYASGRNAATLPNGTPLTVRLVEPVTVTIEH
jgi:hypothetical protein